MTRAAYYAMRSENRRRARENKLRREVAERSDCPSNALRDLRLIPLLPVPATYATPLNSLIRMQAARRRLVLDHIRCAGKNRSRPVRIPAMRVPETWKKLPYVRRRIRLPGDVHLTTAARRGRTRGRGYALSEPVSSPVAATTPRGQRAIWPLTPYWSANVANENSHTPGPWLFDQCTFYPTRSSSGAFQVFSSADRETVICSRTPYEDRAEEMIANARLIAAAPEMLYVLQGIANSTAEKSTRDLARRAIEKATGATS